MASIAMPLVRWRPKHRVVMVGLGNGVGMVPKGGSPIVASNRRG